MTKFTFVYEGRTMNWLNNMKTESPTEYAYFIERLKPEKIIIEEEDND